MAGRAFPAIFAPVLLTLVGLAGCVEPPPAAPAAEAMQAHGIPEEMFSLVGHECEEGGFVALYPLGPGDRRAGVWELADIRDEVGKPVRDGLGQPLLGPAMGNWHQGYRCARVESDAGAAQQYIFGWIGNMVKAPAWDPGGADVHVLLAGLGFGNGTIAESLRGTTSAAISHAYEPTQVTWYVPRSAPRSAVHAIYSDVEKGIYTSYSAMSKYRDFPERTIRLWWQVPADGSQAHAGHDHLSAESQQQPEPTAWHPVYWDIHTSGGEQYTTPPIDSPEVACHMGTPDHGPQGGACQPTLTTVYEHKSLEFRSGHVFEDVVLTEIWKH